MITSFKRLKSTSIVCLPYWEKLGVVNLINRRISTASQSLFGFVTQRPRSPTEWKSVALRPRGDYTNSIVGLYLAAVWRRLLGDDCHIGAVN